MLEQTNCKLLLLQSGVDPTPHPGNVIFLCLWIMSHSRINSKSTLNFAKSLTPGDQNQCLVGGECLFKQPIAAAQQPWRTEVLACLTLELVQLEMQTPELQQLSAANAITLCCSQNYSGLGTGRALISG